jgi:hypothetical protein
MNDKKQSGGVKMIQFQDGVAMLSFSADMTGEIMVMLGSTAVALTAADVKKLHEWLGDHIVESQAPQAVALMSTSDTEYFSLVESQEDELANDH